MNPTKLTGLSCLFLFLFRVYPITSFGQSAESSVAGAGNVRINSAVRVQIAPGVDAYSVDYNYDIPGKSSVYIAGLGIVPGRGHFHYLTSAKNLEIDDALDGTPIVIQTIQETTVVAAKPPLNQIPPIAEFETTHKAYAWKSNRSLQQHLDDLLNSHFRYLPLEHQKSSTIVTSFAPLALAGSPNGTIAQVALLISFPHESVPGEFRFYVQTDLQEGRSHSDDFHQTSDPRIVDACDRFLANLFAGIPPAKADQR